MTTSNPVADVLTRVESSDLPNAVTLANVKQRRDKSKRAEPTTRTAKERSTPRPEAPASVHVSTSRDPISHLGDRAPSTTPKNNLDNLDTWTTTENANNSDASSVQAVVRVQAASPDKSDSSEESARRDAEAKQAEILERLNERYAFTEIGKDTRSPVIVEFDDDGDLVCRRQVLNFHTAVFYTQRLWVPIMTSKGVEFKKATEWWLEHAHHRWHRNIVLAPPGSPLLPLDTQDFNLWTGFAATPSRGDRSKNRDHLYKAICGGDERLFKWLLNWIAALVQTPGQHGWVAPVLVGGQGVGKGHLAHSTLGKLFRPRQYAHLGSADELTGQFTEHLSAKVLVYADESFWGNKMAAESLKRYVTEDTVMIHPKHFPRFEEQSNLHIIIASNADRPLPIERDDRRFAVFQVSEDWKNDQQHFRGLREELGNGGRAAMLYDLLNMHVNDDWLRQPPTSAAKTRMKADSLGPIDLFFQEVLQDADTWNSTMARDPFYERFQTWFTEHRYGGPVPTRERLGNHFATLFKHGGKPGYPRQGKVTDASSLRKNAWVFPPLEDCRAVFEKATGTAPIWTPPD